MKENETKKNEIKTKIHRQMEPTNYIMISCRALHHHYVRCILLFFILFFFFKYLFSLTSINFVSFNVPMAMRADLMFMRRKKNMLSIVAREEKIF